MHQTLLLIPPWLFEGPLLVGWLVISLAMIGFSIVKHGWKQETWGLLPVVLVAGAVIYFVLPKLMIEGTNPQDPNGPTIPVGLAIRGYGVMMLLAILSGVGLAIARGTQVGISADKIISLAFWAIICGIVGARLLYVVQKFDQFQAESAGEFLFSVVDMTKGGLVVYGSFFGALVASGIVVWRHKLPLWLTLDVIGPALVIGVALGRIGCLLNGCCFGGHCDVQWAAVKFPAGSPPYMRQLETGELIGLQTKTSPEVPGGRVVTAVQAGSLADELGIAAGETIHIAHDGDRVFRDRLVRQIPIESNVRVHSDSAATRYVPLARFQGESAGQELHKSLQIHPTQLYSAINAFLLAAVSWFGFSFRRRDGDVFGLLMILYAITRFLLEYVRTDEAPVDPLGWFTISQWISILIGIGGLVILLALRHRPLAGGTPKT